MAKEIMLTPSQMRDMARTIRGYREEHSDIMNCLTNLVTSLCTVWRGEAQDAFVAKYLGMKTTFQNFEEAIGAFADLMETTANNMEQTDNSLASQIRNV